MTETEYTTMINSLNEQLKKGEITQGEFYDLRNDAKDQQMITEMEEAAVRKLANLVKKSELGQRFRDRTFETFVSTKENQLAFDKSIEYAKGFVDEKKGLIYFGTVGTGKTHLSAAITNYILDTHKIPVKFGSITSLLNSIKATYSDGSKETEHNIIKELSSVDLLIIDDLGKEKPTDWTISILYTIINNRYEDYKPTIVTTNLTINNLEKNIGEAAMSRLIEMCDFVKMNGVDYRKSKIMK